MNWQTWTVAITGMNAKPDNPGPGYAVARCLVEAPHFRGKLIGLGYDTLDPGLYAASTLDAGFLLPYPSAGAEALWERILQIHSQTRIDVIIPCLDSEIQTYINLEPKLETLGIRVLLPSTQSLRQRDKDVLAKLCAAAGVSHPKTRPVGRSEFFDQCQELGWDYPLVVKGPFYDARVCYNPVQARAAFRSLVEQWGFPVLAQEFVSGQELNLTAVADQQSELQATVMMAKRALTDKGKAWAGVTVIDEELERMAQSLATHLQWRGPLEVEALRGEDGTLHLIEINPRFPAWIYLSAGVHRNLPVLLLRMLDGQTNFHFPPLQAGHMFIRFAQELVLSLDVFERLMMTGQRTTPTHTMLKEAL